jgi:hypothetical protein
MIIEAIWEGYMQQNIVYTENQITEMDDFFRYCNLNNANFNNYYDIVAKAEGYIKENQSKGDKVTCPIPLLCFSALITYRGDNLTDIVKRDMSRTDMDMEELDNEFSDKCLLDIN